MNLLKKLFNQYKILLAIILVVGILIFAVYQELKPKEHFVTIISDPPTATITIDGQYAGVGSIQPRLLQGKHSVAVSLVGYKPSSQDIFVNKPSSITIKLELEESTQTLDPIEEFVISEGVTGEQLGALFIGLNRLDSLLYAYTKNDIRPLHDQPIESFSYHHPNVLILEKRNTRDVVVLDLQTGGSRRVNLSALAPVVSVGFSPNGEQVLFLASLDVDTRTTTLYQSDTSFANPTKIGVTKATKIEPLLNNQVLLFEEADGLDLSRVVIFDTQNKKELLRRTANSYLVSPDKQLVLFKDSKNLSLYNTQSKQVVSNPASEASYLLAFSPENQPLKVINTLPGVTISYLNTASLSSESSVVLTDLANNSLRWMIGIQDKLLIGIDTNGKVWQVVLP